MSSTDPSSIEGFLANFYSGTEGFAGLCVYGDRKTHSWFPVDNLAPMARSAAAAPCSDHVYFNLATRETDLGQWTRGGDKDCHHLTSMWVDLDIMGDNHKAQQSGKRLAPDIPAANEVIAQCPIPPSVVVHTGGGLHAYWMIDRPLSTTEAHLLLSQWAGLWKDISAETGYLIDPVWDLARMLRVPGTTNPKNGAPCNLASADWDLRYPLADISRICPDARLTPSAPPLVHDSPPRPGDGFNGAHSVEEVLVDVLGFVVERSDRQGTHYTRPGKDPKQGSSATVYANTPDKVVIWSSTCQQTWPALELQRPYDAFGLLVATKYAGEFSRAASDLGDDYGPDDEGSRLMRYLEQYCQPSLPPSSTAPTSRPMSAYNVERVEWYWAARIPKGKLVLIDGDPGVSKSTLTLDIAARLSTGSPFPGETTRHQPITVMLLSAEDGWSDTVYPRLSSHGADPDRVFFWDGPNRQRSGGGVEQIFPSFPSCTEDLEREITANGAGLVVIDPLSAFYDPDIQTNNDASVRRALAPLANVAARTGATIVIVRHLTKDATKSALYRGGGSIGIIGAARTAFAVAPHPDDHQLRVFAMSKNNLSPVLPKSYTYRVLTDEINQCAHISWDREIVMTADELLANQGANETRLDEAVEWLTDYLADGPRASSQLERDSQIAGHSWATIRRAAKQLKVKKYKEPGAGKASGWSWRLDNDPKPPLRLLATGG